MKLIIITGFTLLLFTSIISGSEINGRFVVTPAGSSKVAVLLQLNSISGTDALGGATVVFGFDTASISFTSNPVKNVDYIYHNFNSGYYSPATITRPMKDRIWVNIDLPYNNSNNGTDISDTSGWTDVATVYFDITNFNASADLYWLTGSPFWGIYADDNMTLLNPGSFQNTTNTSGKFQLTVNTVAGWNLVSIPGLLPANQNVTSWWSGMDPSTGVLKFANGLQPVTIASPGEGYWMINLTTQTYNTGDEWPSEGISVVPHDPVPLNAGWNLVGGYEESVPAAGITTTPPGIITAAIYKYVPGAGWRSAVTFDPGYGYWLKASSDGLLNIPSASANYPKMLAGPSTKGFGKITITDAAQQSSTLYSVNGEADLEQFELPPYPPEGMFDIRYSSGKYAERLNSPKAIEMMGIQYPLTVKAEETGIILYDETGQEIARLKPGEEVTINTSASKLMVSAVVIAEYSIEQNYPNPFNPKTIIRWQSPAGSHQTLKVYDILGNEVAALVDEYRAAGSYEISFDASNLASGIYVYRLTAGSFTETRKMVLLR